MRAFQMAKKSVKSKSKHGVDYIERKEFRIFLQYLRQFFEYQEAFKRIDENNDQRISLEEFKENIDTI